MTSGPGLYVLIAALGGGVIWQLVRNRGRARELRAYARESGFTYIGDTLPRSFPFGKSSLRKWTVPHVLAGDRHRVEIVVFDCAIGSGESRLMRTVVGVRGIDRDFAGLRYDAALVSEQIDDWTLVYLPDERLSPKVIEGLISGV